jgi:hypothetical protein
MPQANRKYQVAPDVLTQPVSDETVLLNLQNDHYYSLDDVGTRMLHLLIDSGEPEKVIQHMLEEYAVGEATLRQDLEELIEKLLEAGILQSPADTVKD